MLYLEIMELRSCVADYRHLSLYYFSFLTEYRIYFKSRIIESLEGQRALTLGEYKCILRS